LIGHRNRAPQHLFQESTDIECVARSIDQVVAVEKLLQAALPRRLSEEVLVADRILLIEQVSR
jgi:hypothetical protein